MNTRKPAVRSLHLTPLAAALLLALPLFATPAAQAAPAVAHWTLTDLGDLPGGSDYSVANGINAAGQVVGHSTPSTGTRAFLWQNGGMTNLGDLPGGSDASRANGINAAGQVVGYSNASTGSRAFLWQNGVMSDLNSFNGVAGSGFTMQEAKAINDLGQVVGYGTNSGGANHGFLLTQDTTVWEASGYGSYWDTTSNWSYDLAPNKNTHAIIDPATSQTIYGPGGAATVKQLTVGGAADGNPGYATLFLNNSVIEVLGNGGQFTTITAKGLVTGTGVIKGAVVNQGVIGAQDLSFTDGLSNQGTVQGNGRISTNLTNASSGWVRVNNGERLEITGTTHSNQGRFDLYQGELQLRGALDNQSGGRILLNDARLFAQDGVNNSGLIQVTFGESTLSGNLTTQSGGKIILSGNSQTTFYDTVDIKSGGELRVSTGSSAVFFSQVYQRSGSLFTGTGSKFYEGGLSVGASPGFGADGGDVSFGAGNVYLAEIGGTVSGTEYDFYDVAGELSLGGTLELVSWDGYVAQAGDSFDLFDWDTLSGEFDVIDSDGLLLATGTKLDTSRLYIDGTVSVTAVPEPETYALMLAGLGLVGFASRRRPSAKSV